MVDPFVHDGFTVTSMSRAINKLPNLFGRVAGIFTETPINTTTFEVEQRDGALNIVRSRPRGAAADKMHADKRSMRIFKVPHVPLMDDILPDEVQNVRAFGSEAVEQLAAVIARKQQSMRNVLDQTREYLACGALKGLILDADGSTVYNLYTEFGITAASNPGDLGKYLSLSFGLNDEDTEILEKTMDVKNHIETNLRGETYTGVRVLCSSGWFKKFVTHPKVKDAFRYYQQNQQSLAGVNRKGFTFDDITFEQYTASWTDKDGNARPAIAANQAIAYPEGTGNTFETVVAPGNFTDTANTMGLPYYSRMAEKRPGMNQGYDLWSEMNVLPICKRPEVLVTLTL